MSKKLCRVQVTAELMHLLFSKILDAPVEVNCISYTNSNETYDIYIEGYGEEVKEGNEVPIQYLLLTKDLEEFFKTGTHSTLSPVNIMEALSNG